MADRVLTSALPPWVQTCHGSGVQVMMRPLGPGMMQQIQQPCARCNQTGYSTPAHDTCTDCSGKVCNFARHASLTRTRAAAASGGPPDSIALLTPLHAPAEGNTDALGDLWE